MDPFGLGKLLGWNKEEKKKKPFKQATPQAPQPIQQPRPAVNNTGLLKIPNGNTPGTFQQPKPINQAPIAPLKVQAPVIPQQQLPNGAGQPKQAPTGPTFNDVGKLLFGGTAKLANQGFGVVEKAAVNTQGAVQKLLGDSVGSDRTIREGNESINNRLLKPGAGLFGAGGIYKSTDELHNANIPNVLQKAGGTALQSASEVLPIGRGIQVARGAAPIARKVISGAIQGGLSGGIGSAGSQIVEDGRIDPGETLRGSAIGALLGGGTTAVASGVSKAISKLAPHMPSMVKSPALPEHPTVTSAPAQSRFIADDRAELLNDLKGLVAKATVDRPQTEPAALPTFDTKKVSNLDKAVRSTRSIIERQGKSGETLANSLRNSRDTQEIYLGELQKAMPTVTKLANPKGLNRDSWTNKSFENFVEAAQGLAEPNSPVIAKAVQEWKAVHPTIRQRAVDAGLDVGDLGENYYPHFIDYDQVFNDKNTYNEAINHLVKTGQAPTPEEAIKLLGYAKETSRNREFGNLEASREVDLPFYDKTPNSLSSYLNGSAKRIAHTETFGAKDEEALKLINKIGLEGGDTEAAKNAFDIAVGAKRYNPTSEAISNGIRKYITTTRLGLGALTNVSQNVNTGIVTGHLRTMGAMIKQLNPETKRFVEDTGVISDALLNDLKTQSGYESFTSKVFGKALNKVTAPLFGSVEKFNRAVSATAGRDYALRLAQKGDEKTLRKLGVTGDILGKTLSEAQQVQAARKVVEKTQFKVDPQDLPGWTSSPGGKLVSQFRTFSYAQGKFMSNEILKPAVKGNLMPLGRLLAALPVGYGLYETRRALDGRAEEDDKAKVALQSFGKIGGAGLAFDLYQSINPVGSKYLPTDRRVAMVTGALGGPAVGQATSLVGGLSEATQQKNVPDNNPDLVGKIAVRSSNEEGDKYNDLTSLTRFGLQQVPIVGTPTSNRVLPYKKIADADNGEGSGGSSLTASIKTLDKDQKKKTLALKEAVGKENYEISSLNNSEKQQLIDSGKLTQDRIDKAEELVATKRDELGLSSTKKKSTYADKYSAAQKEFKKNSSSWSVVEKTKKQKELNNLSVQKDFDTDTVDLYGMSKDDVYDLVSTDSDGNKRVKDLLAYGDARVSAGLDETNKFRDKNGNLKLSAKVAKSGGKKGKTFKAPKSSFNRVSSSAGIRKLLQSSGKKLKETV